MDASRLLACERERWERGYCMSCSRQRERADLSQCDRCRARHKACKRARRHSGYPSSVLTGWGRLWCEPGHATTG